MTCKKGGEKRKNKRDKRRGKDGVWRCWQKKPKNCAKKSIFLLNKGLAQDCICVSIKDNNSKSLFRPRGHRKKEREREKKRVKGFFGYPAIASIPPPPPLPPPPGDRLCDFHQHHHHQPTNLTHSPLPPKTGGGAATPCMRVPICVYIKKRERGGK